MSHAPRTTPAPGPIPAWALGFFLASCGVPDRGGDEPDEPARLRRYLTAEWAQSEVAGAGGVVLVARGERVLIREAFGLARRKPPRPMEPDDILPIGSITKSFTAAAILRLVDEGALNLDDDVRLYVPEAPTAGRTVTLEQLLTHTSGMPNLIDSQGFEEWARKERSTDELVGRTRGLAWLSEPGEAFHYSDSGYILLGAVVERVTAMPYAEFVARELTGPLRMRSTRSALARERDDPVGYTAGGAPDEMHMSIPHASGALASNVHDLARWVRAFEAGEVVSADLARRAWSARTLPDGTVSGYGFGWKRDTLAGHPLVAHGGWVPGFTATLAHVPEEGLTAVVLVNDDEGPVAGYVARRCLRLLLQGSPFVRTLEIDAAQRARLAGTYRTARGTLLHVEPSEGPTGLSVRWEGDPAYPLVALTPWKLAVAESDGTWCFTFEPASDLSPSVRPSLSGEPRELASRVP